MEYPFKDLQPLDEVTARTGYYKDWTHIDADTFHQISELVTFIREKGYGADTREAIAQALERVYHDAMQSDNANMEVSVARKHFKDLASRLNDSDGKLSSARSEIAGARRGYSTLAESLGNLSVNMINRNLGKLDGSYFSDDFIDELNSGNIDVTRLLDNSVTMQKLSFTPVIGNVGKNLFDKRTADLNKGISATTGALTESTEHYVSQFIKADAGSDIALTTQNNADDFFLVVFFGASSTPTGFINTINDGTTFVMPQGSTRFKVRGHIDYIDSHQVELGTTQTSFEPFGHYLDTETIKNKSISKDKINLHESVLPSDTTFVEQIELDSQEIDVKSNFTFVDGKVVSGTNGQLTDDIYYMTTEQIDVSEYSAIFSYAGDSATSTHYPLAFLDETGNYVGGAEQVSNFQNSYFQGHRGRLTEIPDTAKFAYISSGRSAFDNYNFLLIKKVYGNKIKNLVLDTQENKLQGKRIGFLGDSIVEDEPYFFGKLQESLGLAELVDYGVGGTSYVLRGNPLWDDQTVTKRSKLIDTTLDGTFTLAGTNDFGTGATLGTFEDRDESTFYGALHETFSYLAENFEFNYVFTMPPRYNQTTKNGVGHYVYEYAEAIKRVAAHYSITCIDILSNSQARPWVQWSKEKYYKGADGLHPNEALYDIILDTSIPIIKQS